MHHPLHSLTDGQEAPDGANPVRAVKTSTGSLHAGLIDRLRAVPHLIAECEGVTVIEPLQFLRVVEGIAGAGVPLSGSGAHKSNILSHGAS